MKIKKKNQIKNFNKYNNNNNNNNNNNDADDNDDEESFYGGGGGDGGNSTIDWQNKFEKLTDRFVYLFNNKTLADVYFYFPIVDQKIPAHTFLLIINSSVFEQIFCKLSIEKNHNNNINNNNNNNNTDVNNTSMITNAINGDNVQTVENIKVIAIDSVLSDSAASISSTSSSNINHTIHTTDPNNTSDLDKKLFTLNELQFEITIIDCAYDSFMEVLRYLYTNEMNLNFNIFDDVLNVSRKYKLNHLLNYCLKFFKQQLTSENVFQLYKRYIESSTIQACVPVVVVVAAVVVDLQIPQIIQYFIENHTKDILKSRQQQQQQQQIIDLTRSELEIILRCDTLEINEFEIFKLIDGWTINQCQLLSLKSNGENKRKIIGDLINLIRFPTMLPQEFNNCMIIESGYLTEQDQLNIFKYCCLGFVEKNLQFPTEIRKLSQRNLKHCTIVEDDDGSMPILYCCDREWINLSFSTNTSVLLFSMSIYGQHIISNNNNNNNNNNNTIINVDAPNNIINPCYVTVTYNNIKYFNDIVNFRNDGSHPEMITFLKPIYIKFGRWCTIIIEYHNLITSSSTSSSSTSSSSTSSSSTSSTTTRNNNDGGEDNHRTYSSASSSSSSISSELTTPQSSNSIVDNNNHHHDHHPSSMISTAVSCSESSQMGSSTSLNSTITTSSNISSSSSTGSSSTITSLYEIGNVYCGKLIKQKILIDDTVIFQIKDAGTVYDISFKIDQ